MTENSFKWYEVLHVIEKDSPNSVTKKKPQDNLPSKDSFQYNALSKGRKNSLTEMQCFIDFQTNASNEETKANNYTKS